MVDKKQEEEIPKQEELEDEVELTDEELEEFLASEAEDDGRPIQKKLIHEWQAQERPYVPLNREMFTTVVAGVFLLGVILFVIEGIFPVMLLSSVVFLWYVMGTVKPQKAICRILTWGIETGNKLYLFEMMTRFWFEGKDENRMLVIELNQTWPRHLRVMVDNEETEAILSEVLEDIMVRDQPLPNWLDKVTRWFEKQVRWSVKS